MRVMVWIADDSIDLLICCGFFICHHSDFSNIPNAAN